MANSKPQIHPLAVLFGLFTMSSGAYAAVKLTEYALDGGMMLIAAIFLVVWPIISGAICAWVSYTSYKAFNGDYERRYPVQGLTQFRVRIRRVPLGVAVFVDVRSIYPQPMRVELVGKTRVLFSDGELQVGTEQSHDVSFQAIVQARGTAWQELGSFLADDACASACYVKVMLPPATFIGYDTVRHDLPEEVALLRPK